jgi:hypothetical protein
MTKDTASGFEFEKTENKIFEWEFKICGRYNIEIVH